MNVYTTFESLYDDPTSNAILEHELDVIPIKEVVVVEQTDMVEEIECAITVGSIEE